MVTTEVCVDSVAGAQVAARHGADRIELCSALELGGITPSAGLVEAVVDLLPTHVLIRPRAGDFVYDRAELRVMAKDVELAIDRGAASVVIGALTDAGEVDVPAMTRLLGAAGEVPVTFSRAFDLAADQLAALDVLLELGVDRLLTSGGRPTALEGVPAIAEFVRRAGSDLCILPGGGVTPDTVAGVLAATGATEIHFSARSRLSPRPAGLPLGPADGGARFVTDPAKVRAIVAAVADLPER